MQDLQNSYGQALQAGHDITIKGWHSHDNTFTVVMFVICFNLLLVVLFVVLCLEIGTDADRHNLSITVTFTIFP